MSLRSTMYSSSVFLAGVACLTGLSNAQYPAQKDIPPSLDLDTLANNSLYLRWRPQYHVLPPGGWMNDPCGPMYDNLTGLYHIFYQAHPQHVMAGNIGWSHATSKDLVTWTDVSDWRDSKMESIKPSPYPSNDWLGVFSGGAQPVGLDGKQDGNLTMMYTGDNKLPDFWASPYAHFTEGQFIATSSDGGVTWQKYPGNPVLGNTPPGNWNVTGWRDPLFFPDTNLDVILGQTEPHYYMTFGTGIRGDPVNATNSPGAGPRIAVYSAKASNLTNWNFLGALFEVPQNHSFGGDATKTGNFAFNFEMSSVFSVSEEVKNGGDGDTRHWIATFGSEGNADRVHPLPHWSHYALGGLEKRQNASVNMNIQAAGLLDWGNSYAMNQFYDSKNDRRILWGWSAEDMNNTGARAQGFQGSLGLPREIYVLKTHNVSAPAGGVSEGPDYWVQGRDGKSFTVTTVGQRPAADVVGAIQQNRRDLGTLKASNNEVRLAGINSDRYHLKLTISDVPKNGSVGVRTRMSPGKEEYTTITYFASNNSVVLDRSRSSQSTEFIKDTYVGYHQPYTYTDGRVQPLAMDLYVDGSLLEIFINDRFAMTARVYPLRHDATQASIFSTGGGIGGASTATFANISVWDKFANIWPQRPLNASSPLLFDSYNMTHVTFNTSRVPYVPYEVYPGY